MKQLAASRTELGDDGAIQVNVLIWDGVPPEDADSESVLARLDATETHRADGSIVATIDGRPHIIDRDGQLVSPADHVEAWLGLRAVA